MALSEHQKEILRFVGDREVATKEIVQHFMRNYFANGRHHVYQRIDRLHKRNLLIRVRHGVYKVGKGGTKSTESDPNQLNLF